MHEVGEFASHAHIRTTELYFVRKEEDAELAACRIQIRRRNSGCNAPIPIPMRGAELASAFWYDRYVCPVAEPAKLGPKVNHAAIP
jgi:hypothetical protein